MSSHRYLDVMTVRPSECGSHTASASHLALLVEPVLLPESLSHVSVEKSMNNSDSCLFYPSGKKNVNLTQVVKEEMTSCAAGYTVRGKKGKMYYLRKPTPKEPVKSRGRLYYGLPEDKKTQDLLTTMRGNEHKIQSTISMKT